VSADLVELEAVNAAFYQAFEARDLDAMSDLWLHEAHVVCTHPGWATLRGWPAVGASWFALFQSDQSVQIILTRLEVVVRGDIGWVSVDENLISGVQAGTVAALNLFERVEGRWKVVGHHGSSLVTPSSGVSPDDGI
jgi:ketosteroid isomerase-like protein